MRCVHLVGGESIVRFHAEVSSRMPKVSVVAMAEPTRLREAAFATGP